VADETYLRGLESKALTAIRSGFPRGIPPTAADMRNDHCPECQGTAALFASKHWDDVTASDLAHNPALTLLTEAGVRYYLPALMVLCVEAPGALDCVPSGVVGLLSPPNGKPSARLAEMHRSFDDAQRAAVAAFLEVAAAREKWDRFPPEAFDTAPVSKPLQRAIAYWSGPN